MTRLADGKFHSGSELGAGLGITRGAVWNAIRKLSSRGLAVESVPGRGYRLAQPVELLDAERIGGHLVKSSHLLSRLDLLFEVDSTNRYLVQQGMAGTPSGHACLAETQTAGRGRRGRDWVSPLGANLYLSLLWRFNDGPARLAGLSLAVALAMVRAFRGLGIEGIGVKWPNDLLWQGKKVAGVLLEVSGESSGPCQVVIGIGVNIGMRPGTEVGQPWADLQAIQPGLSRNAVAGALLDELLALLATFDATGLRPWLDEWRAVDLYAGRRVVLLLHHREVIGIARGIDADGLLRLETAEGIQRFASGEVSLRGGDDHAAAG